MTSTLTLFASTFALVFCLGMQSLLVNNKHYIGAFFNSLCIGTCQLILIVKISAGATPAEVAAFLSGGPFGIVTAMFVFNKFKRRA